MLSAPATGDDWLGLTDDAIPVGTAADWSVLPRCGAVVLFSGTARDHAPGRDEVELLEYEAYEEHVVPRLAAIAAEMRTRWPTLGRIVLIHRVGVVAVGESSVVVVHDLEEWQGWTDEVVSADWNAASSSQRATEMQECTQR